jgi:hypothetical protein
MRLYAITATVTEPCNGGMLHRNVPTFYLDADVPGIVLETHARNILRSVTAPPGTKIDVCVEETMAIVETWGLA